MRNRGVPAPLRLRPDRPRPDRPVPDRPIRRPPKARRLIEALPSELRPSEPWPNEPPPSEPRREEAPGEKAPREEPPREEAPRSQPRPGDFGPADRRSAVVSLVSDLPRENRGACPARPPPAGLPRCRSGEVKPRGADRPKTAGRLSGEEDLRLNTEPPSRDRPMLELPNEEVPSLVEPSLVEPSPAEPSRAEPPPPPDREPPSSEPPSTPSRRRLPNLTLAVPAPSPAGANAAPRPAGARCPDRPSLSWGSRRATGRTAPGPRRPPIEPGPLSRSDSRSRGPFPPASCLIAPWLAPGTGVLAWLGDQPARRPSPRAPPRRSAAAAAYSTNGHSSTS